MSEPGARTARRAVATAVLLGLIVVLASSFPAVAAPENTKISAVYELPCTGSSCDGDDNSVPSGAMVDDAIEVKVSSQSTLGLSELRLDAAPAGSTAWVCLKWWNAGGDTSFTGRTTWNTRTWPSTKPYNCAASDSYGNFTKNGAYTLKVTATERTTGYKRSDTFSIGLGNRAQAPMWASEPSVSGESRRSPVVTLRWQANDEPDVAEYRFYRSDDSTCRSTCEFAVSAEDPDGQGCELQSGVYTCEDDYFEPTGFSGTYSYTLIAFREAPSGPGCAIPPNPSCVPGHESDPRTASLQEPPPPPTPTPTEEAGGGSGGGSSPSPTQTAEQQRRDQVLGRRYRSGSGTSSKPTPYFIPDTFDPTLPFGERDSLTPQIGTEQGETGSPPRELASGNTSEERPDARGLLVPVAAALLLFLTASHLARLISPKAEGPDGDGTA